MSIFKIVNFALAAIVILLTLAGMYQTIHGIDCTTSAPEMADEKNFTPCVNGTMYAINRQGNKTSASISCESTLIGAYKKVNCFSRQLLDGRLWDIFWSLGSAICILFVVLFLPFPVVTRLGLATLISYQSMRYLDLPPLFGVIIFVLLMSGDTFLSELELRFDSKDTGNSLFGLLDLTGTKSSQKRSKTGRFRSN